MKLIVTFEATLIPGKKSEWPTLLLGRCLDVRQSDSVLRNAVDNAHIASTTGPDLATEPGWPWRCNDPLNGTPHAHPKSGDAEWRDPSDMAEAERQRQR